MAYEQFLFSLDNREDMLQDLEQTIIRYYSKARYKPEIVPGSDRIVLDYGGYTFTFLLENDEWIIDESEDIAYSFGSHRSDCTKIASCSTRVEFYGDDDYNMDYLNESIFVLEFIKKKLRDVVIFDQSHGVFFDEEY